MRKRSTLLGVFGLSAVASLLLGLGCTGLPVLDHQYDYFARPDPRDAWTTKIAGWQRREFAEENGVLSIASRSSQGLEIEAVLSQAGVSGAAEDAAALLPDASGSGLRSKYFSFRAERKRNTARQLADWIQSQAKQHYVADGPIDHWATLEETLRGNGDDCDGLELLVYHALRDLGFAENEVYRAIVYRPSDSQHHMVTLWFEVPTDPWVIDPTGAMTHTMVRMSDLPAWVPLKVFSETAEFTVRKGAPSSELATIASTP